MRDGCAAWAVIGSLWLIPACQKSTSAGGTEDVDYPGATQYCDGHVTAAPQGGKPGPHIAWRAFATSDDRTKVVEYHMNKLGKSNHSRDGDEDSWSFPMKEPHRVISVAPLSAPGPWSKCDKPANAATVIMKSTIATAE